MKRVAALILILALVTMGSLNVFAHGDEKKVEPYKVTSETVADAVDDHDAELESDQGSDMERDFRIISEEVADSAIFTIIKALALAASIAGIAIVYLGRGRGGESE